MVLLEVQDVSFSFGDQKVVDQVSFSVGKASASVFSDQMGQARRRSQRLLWVCCGLKRGT